MTRTDVAAQHSGGGDGQLSGRSDGSSAPGATRSSAAGATRSSAAGATGSRAAGATGQTAPGGTRSRAAGATGQTAPGVTESRRPEIGPRTPAGDWAQEVRRLAAQRDAVILAHNYQAPEIQDVADHVGDSLALSRLAAQSTASVIVFAGVYFMAETAKILAPDRTVLIPEPEAGCSLADTITAAAGPGLEGRAPRCRGGRLREHQRRGQGRSRSVLHLG